MTGAVTLEDLEQAIGFVFASMSRAPESGLPGDEQITGVVADIAASIQGPAEPAHQTRTARDRQAVGNDREVRS
jgi:hypothetical protein